MAKTPEEPAKPENSIDPVLGVKVTESLRKNFAKHFPGNEQTHCLGMWEAACIRFAAVQAANTDTSPGNKLPEPTIDNKAGTIKTATGLGNPQGAGLVLERRGEFLAARDYANAVTASKIFGLPNPIDVRDCFITEKKPGCLVAIPTAILRRITSLFGTHT